MRVWKEIDQNALLHTVLDHGFQPKSENFNSDKKGYHQKGILKRNRMALMSAS